MRRPRRPMGELVAEVCGYEIWLERYKPKTAKKVTGEIITVVNKKMKMDMIKASSHIIQIGFGTVDRES